MSALFSPTIFAEVFLLFNLRALENFPIPPGGTGASKYTSQLLILTIPNTHFKATESLRLTIEIHAWAGGAISAKYFFGCDPQNRATTEADTADNNIIFPAGTPSSTIFKVPFKINI